MHVCHAHRCTVEVKPELLMCARHWFMVPRHLREQVLATYRRGQCDDGKPSVDWHIAADLAIAAVAQREGHERAAASFRASAERWRQRKLQDEKQQRELFGR
jgi:hypothetical protein